MEYCIVRLWDLCIAPLSLLAVAILWLAWPALAHGPGGRGSPAFEPYEKGQLPDAFKGRRNPLDQTEETIVAGQRIYQENCVMCHGANAEGKGHMATMLGKGHMATMLDKRPADLRQMLRHFPDVDDYYRWIILEGGERFDLPMPGFEGVLTDTQVWQVVTWMQSGFPGAGTEVKDIMHHDHSQPGSHMMEHHRPAMPEHHREPGAGKPNTK